MSPGTRWVLSSRRSTPSRRTRARGAASFSKASRAFRALSSWDTEITVLNTTMSRMMAVSSQSCPPPAKKERAAAASSTRIMGSRSWASTWRKSPGGLAFSSLFSPYPASRRAPSPWERPWSGSVSRVSSTWRGVSL